MHSSAHFFPKPASPDDRDQRRINDHAAGQYDGRPGNAGRRLAEIVDQQFYGHNEHSSLCNEQRGSGQDRGVYLAYTGSEYQNQSGGNSYDWECKLLIPAAARMHPCDDPKIHADANPVQKDVQIYIGFMEKNRKTENPYKGTAPDHIHGPGAVPEHKKVQKPADDRCYCKNDTDQHRHITSLYRCRIALSGGKRSWRDPVYSLTGVYDFCIA